MTAAVTIRPCTAEDCDAVVALWTACGLVVPWNNPAADFTLALSKSSSTVLAAIDDGGRIVGTAMVGQDGHRGWIYYVAVDPALQGQGLGRRMVAEAEGWLTAAGMPKVQLLVRETNQRVLAFYERLGYARSPVTMMQKWLTNPSP
ncbi:ribosomal protein S18 acetylase RimI-like enzyme [Azospirillum lipoferum]|uniref:GNAT family acetyltransferase n=1 Tax=Azospirillum lipoferum TaxID=193 RepID=A0A5A9GGW8_AZOLI|nr:MULTISPECIES: GNAT family acetyltransferase [Azospirillum]KAA0593586.1 GNAT family acetyltransferase [Azospirillum lipoferum]MCP1608945.1 ribosomal protein S18 acetylase RimI-like enzyme [Azospirillum lipoferum]MDW5535741.1 GNAT family acetyltransferase [Azospirillum sp. NL1]